jgi:hypothetical protein
MRIENKYHIWRATSMDDSRPTLQHVLVARPYEVGVFMKEMHAQAREDWEKIWPELTNNKKNDAVAIATNGWILCFIPVTYEEGDKSGFVHADIFKYSIGRTKAGTTQIDLNPYETVRPSGVRESIIYSKDRYYRRASITQTRQFPNFISILPKDREVKSLKSIAFDRKIMDQACDAIGDDHVKFLFTQEKNPIYFGSGQSFQKGEKLRIKFRAPFAMVMPMFLR